ncbi:MAG: universal stress protein [Methanobacterium sp.]|nr:universal stress protein [Methanobacterium sp.]
MNRKILLPVDNSGSAERAGEYAIATAGLDMADIIVLNVIDTYYLNSLPQNDLREKLDKQFRNEGREAVERYEKKIEDEKCSGNCKNIKLITMIKEGKPEEVILKTAEEEEVDQIIMGKSGKDKIERFFVGSTTERVIRGAKVPVSIIP